MAKAKAQITLYFVVDVKAVYRYYLLQSSTLSKPSKPTTYPPASSWTTTEPSYTSGSTNSLYFVDCTVLCNGSFVYSDVSLSSSYEAAKVAYNKATNAEKVATNYLGFSSEGLVVGDMTASTLGKNVLIDSDSVDIRNGTTTLASFAANKVILGQNAANSEIDLCDGAGTIRALTSGASTSYPQYDSIEIASQEIEMNSQRFVATITNVGDTTPTYQNTSEVYVLSNKSSAGSYARLKSERKTTSSGDLVHAGFSAMAESSVSSTRAMVYAESWDESANKWDNSNQVNVYPTKTTFSKNIVLNGITHTGKNKILWSGSWYLMDSQTATLSEAISTQPHGIVLVWSYYVDGASDNSNFNVFFIPKQFVASHPGKGIAMLLTNATLNIAASKYAYISDSSIKGYSNNSAAAATKSSGILTTPKQFVLRYVIGV